MAEKTGVSVTDVWETHPKLRVGASNCIISYLVERDTHFQDRKGRKREFGSTRSDWIWGANPSMAKQEPGHWSTRLTRLIQFCHPSLRRARGTKYLLAGLQRKSGALQATTESIEQVLVNKSVALADNAPAIQCSETKVQTQCSISKSTPAQKRTTRRNCSISLADFAAFSADLNRFEEKGTMDSIAEEKGTMDSIAEEDDLDEASCSGS